MSTAYRPPLAPDVERALARWPNVPAAFGWLAHTTRGFLSILGKTHKLEVTKQQDGTRYYRLAS